MVIAVGLSGGVDSAVAAALLQQAGHHIVGVTAIVWPGSRCCSDSAILEAQKICLQLGIKHYLVDLTKEFKKKVVDNFVEEYLNARTPNPCTRCNFYIRFDKMYIKIKELVQKDQSTVDVKIATGHYVQVENVNGIRRLKTGRDVLKDQSYMLYHLTQEQLRNLITPLGTKTKEEVRALAKAFHLSPAERAESQDACFIEDDYQSFVANYTANTIKPGNFVMKNGKVMGKHKGIPFYTIGQRRGLNIAYAKPLYVLELIKDTNEIVVGSKEELYRDSLTAADLHWIDPDISKLSLPCMKCKIRYNSTAFDVSVKLLEGNKAKVLFKEQQHAVTPGQNIVFYKDDFVLGGGVIE